MSATAAEMAEYYRNLSEYYRTKCESLEARLLNTAPVNQTYTGRTYADPTGQTAVRNLTRRTH